MNTLPRRLFLNLSAGALCCASLHAAEEPVGKTRYRAVIIGHTGQGNYGHGMDVCFSKRDDVEVVAVADPDEAGRTKAAQRAGAPRHYADYREMLKQEKPQLVSVAPRWSEQHHAMTLAALQAGAHVYSEKPFTVTLAEADELVDLAAKSNLKITVAHQMRLSPNVLHLKKLIDDGAIGQLRELRAHGKQDKRVGGEDLLVLGVHLFNLMHFFGGPAQSCSARVKWQGRDITKADARTIAEKIGPVAGDDISAQYEFGAGVKGFFLSSAENRPAGPWALELIGTKASAKIAADIPPKTFLKSENEWKPVPGDPTLVANTNTPAAGFPSANGRMVEDLLAAIKEKRDPACSGRDAMKAHEMVMAVYCSALSGAPVSLPLQQRTHPLL